MRRRAGADGGERALTGASGDRGVKRDWAWSEVIKGGRGFR